MQTLAVARPEVRITEALDRPALAAVKLSRMHPLAMAVTALSAIAALASLLYAGTHASGEDPGRWFIAWRSLLESMALAGATLLVASTWLRSSAGPSLLMGAATVGLQVATVVTGCFLPMILFVVWASQSAAYALLVPLVLGVIALASYATIISRSVRAVSESRGLSLLLSLHSCLLPVVFAVRLFR